MVASFHCPIDDHSAVSEPEAGKKAVAQASGAGCVGVPEMISPYLLRPLRSLEEVLAERMNRNAPPVDNPHGGPIADNSGAGAERRPTGRPEFVVIDGSKR